MAKRIILLSDGTGNSAAKVWRTNVWRFFESLDLTTSEQVACYDDGVGTSAFKPLAVLGGAFGWGLKRNVLNLYKFLCRNYKEDCEIYLLGFSRGAFTVRVLMGVVIHQGLVKSDSESELHRKAKAAYRAYRRERYHSILGVEKIFRGLRDILIWIKDKLTFQALYDKKNNIPPPSIRFIGVWDTVAAYGLPIEEMTRGISLWLWPLELPSRLLDKSVRRACHAVALDDERTTFHPVLWTELGEKVVAPGPDGRRLLKNERISQVWFPGVHSNVGGGYPDDSLANVALCWMMKEAMLCGLKFKKTPDADPDALLHALSSRDKDGRLYDSRQGMGGYYRYGPRKIKDLCDMRFSRAKDDAVKINQAKIHCSAFERDLNGAHVYAPIGLPAEYAVVTEDGEIKEGGQNPYETPEHAGRRAKGQEHVWNIVWWRRVVYFLTVAASAHLVLFPLIYQSEREAEFMTPFRMVSEAIRLFGGFVPGFFSWWLNSYATNPGKFVVGGLLVGLFIWLGTKLGSAITDQMKQIWKATDDNIPPLPRRGVYALRTSPIYQFVLRQTKRQVVPFFSAVLIVYCAATLGSHILFNVWDAAGYHCKESVTTKPVPDNGNKLTVEHKFRASDLCWASGIVLEEGRRYQVTITQSSPTWKDGSPFSPQGFESPIAGLEISELPSFHDRFWMLMGMPLRRVFLRPWFRVIGRIGAQGTDEYFMDPDKPALLGQPGSKEVSPTFRTRRAGELFLYTNDAVIGWPRFADFFYKNNEGEATVVIQRLPR